MRLLAVAPFAPRRDATHGGGRVVAELLARLAERHELALLHLRAPNDPPADASAFALHAEVVAEPRPGSVWMQRAQRAAALARGRTLRDVECGSRELAARLEEARRTWQPEAEQLFWFESAQYAGTAPTVLVAPEVASTRARDELDGVSARIESALWRRLERRTLGLVDATVTFTEEDRGDLLALAPDARVEVIPFAVEPAEAPLDPLGDDGVVLFVGNFRHTPNVDAAERLAKDIFPLVAAARPGATLRLIGAAPPRSVRDLAGEGIAVAADVPDVARELDRAAVVALPLRRGGGMRVKAVEALGGGKAVVATALALRGTGVENGREAMVAETDDELASAIVHLLAEPDERRRLGGAARAWAERHSRWEPYVQQHEALLRSLA